MKKSFIIGTILSIVLPSLTFAATIGAEKSVTLTVPPPDNTYLAGSSIRIAAAIPADLSLLGGSVTVDAPVAGDLLGVVGTMIVNASTTGDVRILGLHVLVPANTGGDLAVAGGTVISTGAAKDVLIAATNIEARGTATGPVRLYGADVTIDGTYSGDVTVIATDRFTLGSNAHIGGTLRYNAPEQVSVPATATVAGGTTYIGSYRYVPTNQEVQTFALFGIGIFVIVRALSAFIIAGILAGIFPVFTSIVVGQTMTGTVRRTLLMVALGASILLGMPVVAVLLLASFVGLTLSLLIGSAYVVFAILAQAFAGIIFGALLRKYIFVRVRGNTKFIWRDAAIGALVLYFVNKIPFIGFWIVIAFTLFAAGLLGTILFQFVFPKRQF